LIGGFAFGTVSLDESVSQKGFSLGVKQLADLALFDQTGRSQRGPELVTQMQVLRRIGAAVIVELNFKAGEIAQVLNLHLADESLFAAALLASSNHNGRTMSVVCANEQAAVANQLLKSNPNVGLYVFD
jgi:hypothetical protein